MTAGEQEHDEAQCDQLCAGCDETTAITAIDRRSFLTRGALAAAALALAACGGGAGSDVMAPSSVSLALTVANYPALASIGGVALVSASSSPIAVVRTGTSSFVALSRICPHQGATVNISASGFTCPRHGATFNTTGAWVGGQGASSLHSYPTSYDASTGVLTVG